MVKDKFSLQSYSEDTILTWSNFLDLHSLVLFFSVGRAGVGVGSEIKTQHSLIPRSGPRVYLAAWVQRRGLDVNNCSDVGVGPKVSLLQLVPTSHVEITGCRLRGW